MVYLSIGLILVFGFLIGFLLEKIHIPSFIGMIVLGVLLGPTVLNIIAPELLSISSILRQIALVVVLTRSGLNLDFRELKKVGRSAILMCFVPATFEIVAVGVASHFLLNLSWFEGFLLGCVLGAVSPAVVSPRMIKLIQGGYTKKSIPQIILAGSSADDTYTIILFYAFLGIVQNGEFNAVSVGLIPATIISGIALGIMIGIALIFFYKKTNFPLAINVLVFFGISLLLLGMEELLKQYFDISSLLAIMVMGMVVLFKLPKKAKELSRGYDGIWKFFEIILFVLVGAAVDFKYIIESGGFGILVLVIGLIFRSVGVYLCILGTGMNWKEKLFCVFAYLPKATVQASIGGIALSMGLPCGGIILAVAVLAIVITAPIGGFLIDITGKKWLEKVEPVETDDNEVISPTV